MKNTRTDRERSAELKQRYFHWLCSLVCDEYYPNGLSYHKLLQYLHDIPFVYKIEMDVNRAKDGADLRFRFGYESNVTNYEVERYLNGHADCSVLEMMVALAVHCEEQIMSNVKYGDRTSLWFWGMIENLALIDMDDANFDQEKACHIIDRFLNRDYAPNGEGGLFTLEKSKYDLRTVEIYYQAMWYLNEITPD